MIALRNCLLNNTYTGIASRKVPRNGQIHWIVGNKRAVYATRMLALVNTAGDDLITLREVEEPLAAADEAIVNVHTFSLNRGELTLLRTRPEGWRPGQDVAGTVAVPAADGSGPQKGARIVGLVEGGGWAQRVAAKTARLTELPSTVSSELAATLPLAGLTALRTLRIGGSLLGRTALITGADGGVGQFAVRLAALSGARVTAVAKSENARSLRELGAAEVISGSEDPRGQFDLILESVGGSSLDKDIAAIAPGGTIVLYGNSSGTDSKLNLMQFFGHENARIVTFFSYATAPGENRAGPRVAGVPCGRRQSTASDRLAIELERVSPRRARFKRPEASGQGGVRRRLTSLATKARRPRPNAFGSSRQAVEARRSANATDTSLMLVPPS